MDEKTEELRDIFVDVTDADTVTERQEESRGSLTGEGDVDERLAAVVERMRDSHAFDVDLDDESLVRVVRGFYDDESDADVAHDLDVSRGVVFRARMDLHLFREADADAPFGLDDLRSLLDAGRSVAECAEELDVSESTVRRYRRLVEARERSRRAGERFRDEFDAILDDADLTGRLTGEVQEDGLDDATEGMETNVSF